MVLLESLNKNFEKVNIMRPAGTAVEFKPTEYKKRLVEKLEELSLLLMNPACSLEALNTKLLALRLLKVENVEEYVKVFSSPDEVKRKEYTALVASFPNWEKYSESQFGILKKCLVPKIHCAPAVSFPSIAAARGVGARPPSMKAAAVSEPVIAGFEKAAKLLSEIHTDLCNCENAAKLSRPRNANLVKALSAAYDYLTSKRFGIFTMHGKRGKRETRTFVEAILKLNEPTVEEIQIEMRKWLNTSNVRNHSRALYVCESGLFSNLEELRNFKYDKSHTKARKEALEAIRMAPL